MQILSTDEIEALRRPYDSKLDISKIGVCIGFEHTGLPRTVKYTGTDVPRFADKLAYLFYQRAGSERPGERGYWRALLISVNTGVAFLTSKLYAQRHHAVTWAGTCTTNTQLRLPKAS